MTAGLPECWRPCPLLLPDSWAAHPRGVGCPTGLGSCRVALALLFPPSLTSRAESANFIRVFVIEPAFSVAQGGGSGEKMTEQSDAIDLTQPNAHYVKNVEILARTHEVVASEDVFDAHGIKLVAKGARVDQTLHERLLRFKLSQPLEASLSVSDGLTPAKLLAEAEKLLEQIPPLAKLLQPASARSEVMSTIRGMQLGRVSTMLASMGCASQDGTHNHFALAVVTSLGIGVQLGIDTVQLQNIAMAALLHDVGELYINPEYRQRGRALTPEEWKHIAAHPRIGQLVIEGTMSLPKSISIAIAEHHERPNGFGYPRLLGAKDISPMGNILLVTEVLCGVFSKDSNVRERACLAVKVVPGEYPKEIVSLFSTILKQDDNPESVSQNVACTDDVIKRAKRVDLVLNNTLSQLDQQEKFSGAAGKLQDRVRERSLMLRRAMLATGISECLNTESLSSDDMDCLALEIETVVFEIEWRLRELARQVSLAAGEFSADQQRGGFELIVTSLSAD